ncbi:MAG: tyrosine-protein phosphatase, partial [Planctomycetota bacterium]
FCTLAVLLLFVAINSSGWMLLLVWPGLSAGVVGLGYLSLGHRVFGKRNDGTMSWISILILLPYLLYLWTIWHLLHWVSREPAYNTVVDGLVIGRRLLSSEIPTEIATVVDLTSEFPEPSALRNVDHYFGSPMLDASVLAPNELANLASNIAVATPPLYIHCAQGHGRTGLVAALTLIARGDAIDAQTALDLVTSSRPGVSLNRVQQDSLRTVASLLRSRRND